MKRILIAIALCLGVMFGAVTIVSGSPLAIQTVSPVTALETHTLADLEKLLDTNKGKVVMVNFFASWCPPCREEIPGLMRIRKDIAGEKLILIGLSLDTDEATLRAYMAKTKFNYPVSRAGMDLIRSAGVRSIPHMLIFDAKGNLVVNQPGYMAERNLRAFIDGILE